MHFVAMHFVAMHCVAMHCVGWIGDLRLLPPAALAWFASGGEAFARTAGITLVNSIWQGAVIVCGLEICLRIMPRISAAHRFAIWAAGFGVAAGLPLLALLNFGASRAAATGVANSGVTGSSVGPLLQLDARWGLAIAGLWVAASLIRGAVLAVHSIRLRRLWKAARPVDANATLAAALEDVRGGRVTICTTEMLDRPSVIGFLAPRILIPAWLMARLTPDELHQIVLHEAEHLRRGDDWTNLLQKLTLVAFPLNPALAWIEHRLGREREMACDEGVIRITNAPRAYAACLASLAERGLERRAEALTLGAWHRRSELVYRVHGILLRKRGLNKAAASALLGTVGCALVAGSFEMVKAPQLVAFVTARKSLAMTPARHQEMAAMLARENAEAKLSLPVGFHAVQAKAVVPEVERANVVNTKHHALKSAAARAVKAVENEDTKIARVNMAGDRVNADPEQQWIVLSAWEEVRTVTRTSSTIADYYVSMTTTDAAADGAAQTQQNDGKTAENATNRLPNQTSSQYTIRQLILRVAPTNSNSNSTQPAMSVRGGWFVIQL
jgi:beta-lactamase regulating signal transducer with metallopeptidase domain